MFEIIPEIYYDEELARHEAREAANDELEKRRAEYVAYLISEGEECWPWSPDNLQGAIAQLSESEMRNIAITMAVAIVDGKLDNNHSNHLALCSIRAEVDNYWKRVAADIAEDRITEI